MRSCLRGRTRVSRPPRLTRGVLLRPAVKLKPSSSQRCLAKEVPLVMNKNQKRVQKMLGKIAEAVYQRGRSTAAQRQPRQEQHNSMSGQQPMLLLHNPREDNFLGPPGLAEARVAFMSDFVSVTLSLSIGFSLPFASFSFPSLSSSLLHFLPLLNCDFLSFLMLFMLLVFFLYIR